MGSKTYVKTIGMVRFPKEYRHSWSGARDNDLALQSNKLLRGGLDAIELTAGPVMLDFQVVALDPS